MLANLLRVVARFAAIGAALSLGACGANYYSIYRHQPLGGDLPSATLLDATLAYARDLAENTSPRSIRVIKQQLRDLGDPFDGVRTAAAWYCWQALHLARASK